MMDSRELINSIIIGFSKDEKVFITYMSMSENLVKKSISDLGDDVSYIDLKKETTPLAPFLKILSESRPSDKLLKENTYELQYESFRCFFEQGFPNERKDPIILEEIDYEKLRLKESVVALIKKCFSGKVFVFNAQLLSGIQISILKILETEVLKGKMIFCFNSMEMDVLPAETQSLVQNASEKNNYYAFNSIEDIDDLLESNEAEKKDNELIDFKKLAVQLRSYRIFLDMDKAYKMVKDLSATNALMDATLNEQLRNYMEMGLIAFYYGDTDMASFFFNYIIETNLDDEFVCYALCFMAHVSSKKNMNSIALKYIAKALSKCQQLENSSVQALANMMDYIITERADSQYSTTKYFNTLELLDKYGFTNNRIYTSLVIPYGIIYEPDLRHRMLEQVKKAKIDAEKIGNKFGLSIACHWMGIMMTHEDDKKKALDWYNECFRLREEIGDISSIIKVTNGLSYEYLIDTKYRLSYDLINNVISNLLDSKDYPEAVITLYNMARTCFYSRNFDLAYSLFQCIISLMSKFDYSDLALNSFLPEYNDVIAYKAVIDFYSENYTRANMALHNVYNNGKNFTPIEEFVKFFLNACIELHDGNKDEAIKLFEKLVTDFFTVGLSQEHRIVFMFYEFAGMLKSKGYVSEADEYFARGFKIAKEKGLVYFTKGKEKLTFEEYLNGVEKLPALNLDLQELVLKAEKEQLVNQLHKRLRDSQFLNRLTTIHGNSFGDANFANNIVQAVFDYCMADGVYLAEKKEDGWAVLSKSLRENVPAPNDERWEKISQSRKTVEIKKDKKTECHIVSINLSKFEFTGGMVIYLQKNNQLNSEEVNIMNIAAANIQAQLVMLKQNEHLTIISATDQLSMLNNRRALQDHLVVESEMIRRYEKKRNLYLHDAISFIDLDNFKYYNDTFGHEAGDILISCFAKLLKKIYRKVDFVSRFGGDEFVIVLPNTSCSEAALAANRLKQGLIDAEYFIPDLKQLLHKDIYITEDKYLGFSMGISSNSDEEDISDLETTMVNADKALYYSKHHNKGSITIWTDIKDIYKDEKNLECPKR